MQNSRSTQDLLLRDVVEGDLPLFFDFQLDPDANRMAAFTAKDPTDRKAFTAHWNKIMADPKVVLKTIVCDGQVVGSVSSYYDESGKPEVTYWIGRLYWGQGIATRALTTFLVHANTTRPMALHLPSSPHDDEPPRGVHSISSHSDEVLPGAQSARVERNHALAGRRRSPLGGPGPASPRFPPCPPIIDD